MYFQIKEIILWPKNHNFEPRHLNFELDKVNIISGASKTGKSAIIPIIDYCLGSEKCAIPVNTIRNYCEWFGVLIQTKILGQILLARREPGNQKATGDMFIVHKTEVEIPKVIKAKNLNVDDAKKFLDEIAGLTSLDFDFKEQNSGFKGRPSFRDMFSFLFQPQNIIANPDVFFYKADTHEHREKLRMIFPYLLNSITAKLLGIQHELTHLLKELRRKQSELNNIKEISEKWVGEIKIKVSEARDMGLTKRAVNLEQSPEGLIQLLKNVVQDHTDEIKITSETISESIQELIDLQKEESKLSAELMQARRRLTDMSVLKQSTKEYQGALLIQRDRLQLSKWLQNRNGSSHLCPICNNELSKASKQLEKLVVSLKEVEKSVDDFDKVPAAFDREYNSINQEVTILTNKLQSVRIRRAKLEESSEEAKERQYEALKISRFIGNLEQSLLVFSKVGVNSEIQNEVSELQLRVKELEKEISEQQIKERTKRALEKINTIAGRILPVLDAERPEDPITFSINDLTVKVVGLDREDYLWEIGSGSNWLAYHIAVTLAFHQYFLELKQSPIPSFIVYDQPSQVYFPKYFNSLNENLEDDPKYRDEDLEAIKKVFTVFSMFVRKHKSNFQIIVLDHASENVWGTIKDKYLVEEWRDGKKLIPKEWID